MKVKEEIELWDVKDMYEYGVKIYQIPDSLKDEFNYKDSAIRKIKRTLKEHNIQPTKGNSGNEKYQISADIAKYMVQDFLYDYFMGTSTKIEERRAQREEQHRQKVLKDMETKSLERDNEVITQTSATEIVNIIHETMRTTPGYDSNGKIQEKIESSQWKSKNFHKLSDNSDVPKRNLEYHIPDYLVDELDNETVDRIIDRMMIRAIFDLFYDFKEKDFRMALYERAAHIEEISDGGVKPVSGYSELSRRLENPLDFYITKKND